MSRTTSWTGSIERDYRENPIHQSVHIQEFKEIAGEMIQRQVPELVRDTMRAIIPSIVDSMVYDINTIVQISMQDGEELWKGSKVSTLISNKLRDELLARIETIDLTIKF